MSGGALAQVVTNSLGMLFCSTPLFEACHARNLWHFSSDVTMLSVLHDLKNPPHLNAPPWVCVLMSPSSHILQVFITTNFVAESDMQAAHLCLHFHLVKNYEYDLKNSYAKISSRITW
jgi:hypothetical protein